MSGQLNAWWTLPVLTLFAGLGVGYAYQEPQRLPKQVIVNPIVQEDTKPTSVLTPTLAVVNVALPPAAVEYRPQLTAELVNNQVVVTKQQQSPAKVSQQQPKKIDSDSVLAQRFSQVLADMQQEKSEPQTVLHPQSLTRYPQWYQDLVPPLEFSEHIYSSKPNESRVRVNNQVVKEGELIDSRMRIVKIEPQQVVIQLQQRQFTLPALSSW